jgi:hypothetical protein
VHPLDQTSITRREYPLTTSRKIGQVLLAGVFLAGAGFFLKLAVDPIGRDFALAIGGSSLIPGIVLVAHAWSSRLILDGDRIEVRSAFRTRSATRTEIEGLRKIENQYGRWTRVYLKQDLGSFSVSDFFTGNDDLKKWFEGLPDLDGRDADEITKEVSLHESAMQGEMGTSKAFGLAKAWAIGLSVFAGVVSVPVMYISYTPVYKTSLIVLLACPIVGVLILRRFPLLFTVIKRKLDPRAELGFLVIWPGMGVLLSYQTSNDPTHLVDFFQLMYWVLAVLVCFLVVLFPCVWKSPSRWAVLFFLIITGGMYSIGLVSSVNTMPDQSSPSPYETWVLRKGESQSSKGTTYFLRVAPWGPISYPDDVAIPMLTYNKTRVGDPVCYSLYPGFLHAPWYISTSCPVLPAPSTP